MKIKCRKCGKRFDTEMYSGLCPRCGAYNGAHMRDYGAVGSGTAESGTVESSTQAMDMPPEEANDNAGQTLPGAEDSFGQTLPEADGLEPEAAESGRKGISKRTAAVLLLAVCLPVVTYVGFRSWEKGYLSSRAIRGLLLETETVQADGFTVREPGAEGGIFVSVKGAGIIEREEEKTIQAIPEGWHLEAVFLETSADGSFYGGKTRIDSVNLAYQVGEETFYQECLSTYDLENIAYVWEIPENQILSPYGIDYGENAGYFFFLARDGAEKKRLLLELEQDSRGEERIVHEMEVSLEGCAPLPVKSGEEES
ncbi:MAG: hypothetical protein Q4C65_09755 [Eubacteriales bacterium]|nr:hypothetical protein [Eubacteriales bacterium]